MTDLDTRHPEFTLGLRGYDRSQVDDYVEHLQRLVAEAEDRARDAETENVFDTHAAIGPRIAEIFALVEAEARELLGRATSETTEVLSDARTEAKAIIDAAEHAARGARERMARDHTEMLAELESDRDRIRDEVVALEWRKAEAVGELNRLRELLGEAAAGVAAAGNAATTRVLPAADDATVELPSIAGEAEEY